MDQDPRGDGVRGTRAICAGRHAVVKFPVAPPRRAHSLQAPDLDLASAARGEPAPHAKARREPLRTTEDKARCATERGGSMSVPPECLVDIIGRAEANRVLPCATPREPPGIGEDL